MARYVLVTPCRGRKSQAREVPGDGALGGCCHELPPSPLPVSKETRRRVLLEHERALAHGDERCRLDCSARLQLQARLQPRPVFVTFRGQPVPELQGRALGCVQTLTARALLTRLAQARPGAWRLFAAEGRPLPDSARRLRDLLPPGTAPARLVADERRAAEGEEARAEALRKRLRAARASAARGGTEGEREAAARAVERTLVLMAHERVSAPAP